jgi:hypothetical protein
VGPPVFSKTLRFFLRFHFFTPPAPAKKHIDGCPFQQPACPKHFGAGVIPEGVSEAQKGPPPGLSGAEKCQNYGPSVLGNEHLAAGFFPKFRPFFVTCCEARFPCFFAALFLHFFWVSFCSQSKVRVAGLCRLRVVSGTHRNEAGRARTCLCEVFLLRWESFVCCSQSCICSIRLLNGYESA